MQVEELAEDLIQQAYSLKVTDIHIQPLVDRYQVYFRLLGKLTFHRQLSLSLGEKLLSHLKFMALMDISEKRKPQSGAFKLPMNDSSIYVRISTLPTSLSKESLVIRIFSSKKDLSFRMMSLFPNAGFRLLALLMHAHGLLIFTGPTGCVSGDNDI